MFSLLCSHQGCAFSISLAGVQIHRQFRKPLLVVAPKNLLRHPEAKSGLWEFDDKADDKGILGVRFKRLIMDASAEDRHVALPSLAAVSVLGRLFQKAWTACHKNLKLLVQMLA